MSSYLDTFLGGDCFNWRGRFGIDGAGFGVTLAEAFSGRICPVLINRRVYRQGCLSSGCSVLGQACLRVEVRPNSLKMSLVFFFFLAYLIYFS